MELMLGKKWYNFKGCFKNQEKGKIYCNVQDLAVHNEFLWIKIFVAIPYRYLLQIGGFLVKYYGLLFPRNSLIQTFSTIMEDIESGIPCTRFCVFSNSYRVLLN